MRTMKPVRHAGIEPADLDDRDVAGFPDEEPEGDPVRVGCRDCGQPVALTASAEALPVHAKCPAPWNPFGLTVCPGSGRPVTGDAGAFALPESGGTEYEMRATLPEGLDWRLQPFSHAGAGGRPVRLHGMRQAA